MTKYVFVTGGVVSSLGKGITAAALGRLLKARGYKVGICKLDPYLNVDPGTMNPYQHGEVYVTDDGAETDLDVGHYERFINETLSRANSVTSGQIFLTVIERERKGGYVGGTVQFVPHITDEIQRRIMLAAEASNPDVLICEIGGTVGDIEGLPFIEAIRQFKWKAGTENCAFIHVTLVPYISAAGELKSKPTQHSVKELLGFGLQPDIIVCRADRPIGEGIRRKISQFCNVAPDFVVENLSASSLYAVPLMLEENGLCRAVVKKLGLEEREPDLTSWREMVERGEHPERQCRIAVVGKYVQLQDAYLSIAESLHHAGAKLRTEVVIDYISAEKLTEENAAEMLKDEDGLIIPGGFGPRGLAGKRAAIRYARENRMPLLGICLGMQMMAIEFARNVLHLAQANTTEDDPGTPDPVIYLMEGQEKNLDNIGGTQRLGGYDCALAEGSLAGRLYRKDVIRERHRHRWEFNNAYEARFKQAGMMVSGRYQEKNLAEIMEIEDHPFMIGTQFHPELTSRPDAPHPLFVGLVDAANREKEQR